MSVNLYFNNLQLPSFVGVTGIEESVLPIFDDENYRVIKVDFRIRRYKLLTEEQIKSFSMWLRGNNFEYSKLTLPSRENSYYMAIVNNSVDMTNDLRSGSGTIEFKCLPNRIDKLSHIVKFDTEHIVSYLGTVKTYPTIDLDVIQECEEIKLSFSNDKSTNYIKLVGHFNQGQKLRIDSKLKKITVNDVLNMQILTLDSYFHQLEPGDNRYKLINGNCTISITWRNEYLS